MAREKRLNINNSDRYFNINLMKREDIESKVRVTRLNEVAIEKEMDELEKKSHRFPERDTKHYLVYQEKYTNDTLIDKIIRHGGGISYYTDSIVPYYVLTKLSMNLNSEAIYALKPKYTPKEQENVELCYMATKVILDVPVILPDTSPYDLLFSLQALKTNVDKVHISFPPLHKEELSEQHIEYYDYKNGLYYAKASYKYMFFKYIQTSLSLWKMNIWLVSDDNEDHEILNGFVQKDLKKRVPTKKAVANE